MSGPLDAAWEIGDFLKHHDISCVVIGGLAVQIWGDARLTIDADVTISSSLEEGTAPLVKLITKHFHSRVTDPFEFAFKTRMILINASNGVDVDISLALPGYEDSLFARAITYNLEQGKSIQVCSAEDLVIHKAIAGRPQDLIDIQGIIFRQGERLDLNYIIGWITQFANLLENPDVVSRFEKAWGDFTQSDDSTNAFA